MKLSGNVALITGASRGLGFEIAKAYAQRGAELVIAARDGQRLAAAATELAKETDVVALALDVSQDAERLVRAGIDRFGRVDVLVNNASELGPSPMPALESYPWQELERVFRVNVLAPLHLTQLVLPGMKERGGGVIINVSSDAGVEAYPGWGGYGSSKAALEHLSRTLAVELDGTGVRVYAVDPGDMNTEMHQLAEPGVDLSDLPGPAASAPAFVQLVEDQPASGRFQAQELLAAVSQKSM
ncbi:MAG: SDR family oxidoreductase [Chloroflexi bacterium]|nr:SDR family oxidoreductase [Chloroflexota bacterium]MCI0889523.1 SDR family oxidoreductase [Chloroflexota bacterium]